MEPKEECSPCTLSSKTQILRCVHSKHELWTKDSLLSWVSSVQSLSHVWLFSTPWITVGQASMFITNSQSSLRLTSIKTVMPSSHLIIGHPLLLLPLIPPRIRVFSNESTLRMRWPKYWSFSFSIIPSKCNENERINLKTKCIEFLLSLLCARYTCTTSFLQTGIPKSSKNNTFCIMSNENWPEMI